jgi:hypothetical protein
MYIQFEQNGKEYHTNLFHPLDVYEGKAPDDRIFVDYQSYGHALGDPNGGKDRLCYRDFLYFCKTIETRNKTTTLLSWSEYIRLGSFLLSSPIIDVVFPIDPDVKKYGRMTAEKWYQWFAVK